MPQHHQGIRHTDPFDAARRAVAELRARGCSLVVCLSHLGYRSEGERPSDTLLAQRVEGSDLILGGHSHTFLDRPDVYESDDGRRTLVNQVGFGGIRLGRIDVTMAPASAPAHPAGSTLRPQRWSGGSYDVDASLD
ncbi:MAG: hypothetical protein FIA95_15410 [Gemmatimonadetes bacterium]|nr:hypothetical protein [Gemmatimonadota bacterium]